MVCARKLGQSLRNAVTVLRYFLESSGLLGFEVALKAHSMGFQGRPRFGSGDSVINSGDENCGAILTVEKLATQIYKHESPRVS